MFRMILAIVISSIIFIANTASAQWGSPWGENNRGNGNYKAHIEFRFSNYDREIVHQYYKYAKRKKVPPGLAKKKRLPPGLQKRIKNNGKLPPGLQGRHLPYELERKLDRLPRNYARIMLGADIVLMDILTKTILDVIEDVVF